MSGCRDRRKKTTPTYGDLYGHCCFSGPQGSQGAQGSQGSAGPQGSQGAQGSQGDIGPQGSQGNAGPQGSQGNAGPQGDIGPQGSQGNAGAQGSQGAQGAQGAPGPTTQVGSSMFWSDTVQPFAAVNVLQNVQFENGPVGPGVSSWSVGGANNDNLSSTMTGWYLASYRVDYNAGNGVVSTGSFTGIKLSLGGVQVSGSPSLAQSPDDNHIYILTNTIQFAYPTIGQILNVQVITNNPIAISGPAIGYSGANSLWPGRFTEATATITLTRIGDI